MQDTTPENQGVKDVSAGECTQALAAEALAHDRLMLELLQKHGIYVLDGDTAPLSHYILE